MAIDEIISYEGVPMEMLFARGNIGTVLDSVSARFNELAMPAGAGAGAVFPHDTDVRAGEVYGPTGTDFTGNLTLPDVNDVRNGTDYGANGVEFDGDLVLPAEADVKLGVGYGADGTELEGTLAGGGGSNIFINLD